MYRTARAALAATLLAAPVAPVVALVAAAPPAAAAPVSGAKAFRTLAEARAYARSISGTYHTSILGGGNGRLYWVHYWKRGSHG